MQPAPRARGRLQPAPALAPAPAPAPSWRSARGRLSRLPEVRPSLANRRGCYWTANHQRALGGPPPPRPAGRWRRGAWERVARPGVGEAPARGAPSVRPGCWASGSLGEGQRRAAGRQPARPSAARKVLRRFPARDGGSPGRPRPVRRHGRSGARDEAGGGLEAAEGLKVARRPLGVAVSSMAVPP